MKHLTEKERRLAEGLAALHGETGEGVLPSRIQDLLLASEVAVRSLAASRALVEELKTHIKMEGHGETVGITHEEGCHMCRALALKETA